VSLFSHAPFPRVPGSSFQAVPFVCFRPRVTLPFGAAACRILEDSPFSFVIALAFQEIREKFFSLVPDPSCPSKNRINPFLTCVNPVHVLTLLSWSFSVGCERRCSRFSLSEVASETTAFRRFPRHTLLDYMNSASLVRTISKKLLCVLPPQVLLIFLG